MARMPVADGREQMKAHVTQRDIVETTTLIVLHQATNKLQNAVYHETAISHEHFRGNGKAIEHHLCKRLGFENFKDSFDGTHSQA